MAKSGINKIIKILIILLILQISFTTFTYAANGGIFGSANEFLQLGKEQESAIDEAQLKNAVDVIYNILLALGVGISVIVGAVIGIQFMWGSVEAKTKAKEALMPYIIGCVVIFGAFGIWKIAVTLGNDILDSNGTQQQSQQIVLNWQNAKDAQEYIDGGGDLSKVSNEKLLDWYGQLSRVAGSGHGNSSKAYYDKVKKEIDRRGGYDAIKNK